MAAARVSAEQQQLRVEPVASGSGSDSDTMEESEDEREDESDEANEPEDVLSEDEMMRMRAVMQ